MKTSKQIKLLLGLIMLASLSNVNAQSTHAYWNYDGDGAGGADAITPEHPTGIWQPWEIFAAEAAGIPICNTGCSGGGSDCDDWDHNYPDNPCPSGLQTYYQDYDGDGYGSGNAATSQSQPPGWASNNTDCNDFDPAIHPGAAEVCDGVDNDCDGLVDATNYYADADGDGHGDPGSAPVTVNCGDSPPDGTAPNNDDSDDTDSHTHPGARDICDGKDNDGDGQTDEDGDIVTVWVDDDGDGYFRLVLTIEIGCGSGGGSGYTPGADSSACVNDGDCYVPDPNDDCDNNDPGVETCNGTDDDCDGLTDDDDTNVSGTTTWWRDNDEDGFGDALAAEQDAIHSCTQPSGYVDNNSDPDDNNVNIYCGNPVLPTSFWTDGITATTATCNWSDAHAHRYNLRYKVSGSSDPFTVIRNIKATSFSLTGLLTTQPYTWQVRSRCSGTATPWSARQHFGTTRLGESQPDELTTGELRVYPNPVSSSATILFTLENESQVSVTLYDMSGRNVTTLYEGNLSEGSHSLELKKENLASGIYFIQLKTGSEVKRTKVIVE